MNARTVVARCRATLATGGCAVLLPLSGLAVDDAPPETLLSVKVFPGRYVAAGKPFSDLTTLEAWAKPMHFRRLWLDSCGPASAKRLLAAVEHFHAVYEEGIQIRAFALAEPECASAAAQANVAPRTRIGWRPADDEYYASDESGRSTIP